MAWPKKVENSGSEGWRDLLALIPGLSGRDVWTSQPWTPAHRASLPLGSKSRMGHIPQRWLPSYWARMHPQGQAGLGLEKLVFLLPPTPIHTRLGSRGFQEGITGTGGFLLST